MKHVISPSERLVDVTVGLPRVVPITEMRNALVVVAWGIIVPKS